MKQSRIKYVKACVNILVAIVVVLLLALVLPKVIGFFWPFVVGWLIAIVANPLVQFFESKLKIRRKAGSALVVILVLAIIILIGYIVISKLVVEFSNLIVDLPKMWSSLQRDLLSVQNQLQKRFSKGKMAIDISSILDKMISIVEGFFEASMQGNSSVETVSSVVKNVPSAIIGVIMMVLSAYCFVAQKDYVYSILKQIAPKGLQNVYGLVMGSCKKAVGGYFKAQLQIEVWIYFLTVVALLILRVNYALLVALGIALLDFLPFFGTGAVMWPWAVLRIFAGDYKMAIGLLVAWALGQLLRQLIQPRYVGNNVGLSAIPTLFLLYIGYKLGSVLGMIIAVPVGLLLVNMDEAGVFDNLKNSIKIIFRGINEFRRITPEDMDGHEEHVNKVNIMFNESEDEKAIRGPIRYLVMDEVNDIKRKKPHRKKKKEVEKGNDS